MATVPAYAQRELVMALFDEQNWPVCRAECARALLATPDDGDLFLVKTITDARLGNAATGTLARLAKDTELDAALRNLAENELQKARSKRRSRPGGMHWTMQPVRWFLLFYQRQIRPAIGQRCSLDPGCSSFTMEAIRRHGLLGIAMYADRAVREPSLVQEKKHTVYVKGRRRYSDPVDDHDWWMHSRSKNRRERGRRSWVMPLTQAGAAPKGTKNEP
ncbi:MAG: membrane protein insertion efficiency factor YidD [Lentisphaerae bacterium]|nr:membrane protein insertion efficiency factor YidD [Lentisphaerota bacterium]